MYSISKVTSQKSNVESRMSTIKGLLFGLCFFFFGTLSYGQCAMCRAAIEGEGNKVQAQAVNDGIVYLMVIPYILVGGIGYVVYRMRKNKNQ